MPDIGYTTLANITNVKKGASVASGTLKRYSDGSFEATFAGKTRRYPGVPAAEFMKFVVDGINALV